MNFQLYYFVTFSIDSGQRKVAYEYLLWYQKIITWAISTAYRANFKTCDKCMYLFTQGRKSSLPHSFQRAFGMFSAKWLMVTFVMCTKSYAHCKIVYMIIANRVTVVYILCNVLCSVQCDLNLYKFCSVVTVLLTG